MIKTVTDEQIQEAKRLEDDPETIMRLVDLIFMIQDEQKIIPS